VFSLIEATSNAGGFVSVAGTWARNALTALMATIAATAKKNVGAAGSGCDGLHMRVVGQRVSDEPRHHDEQREQHYCDHKPDLDWPIVAELDAPYSFPRPSVLPSGPTRRSRPGS
jgi:hypothetical protein